MSNAVLGALVDDGAGRLTYRGARYLLIRPETLAAWQRATEQAFGAAAAECVAAGGRAGGGRTTAALAGDARARIDALLVMGGELGWGRFALERHSERALVITVAGSPFAEAYGRAEAPVCHLIRGVLDALAGAVLAGAPRVVETACAATGAPLCRFEAGA